MRRTQALAAIPVAFSLMFVAGCGHGNSSSGASGGSPTSSAATAGSGAATGSGAAVECPTSNTRAWAKTRFVTDIGLTAGTFHRWIWKPYKAGSFKKGAHGRLKTTVKAGAISALDLHLMHNAEKNVKANPTLCKVLYKPISNAVDQLGPLKGQVVSGSLGGLSSLESTLSSIMAKGNAHGLGIKESTDQSQASQG